MKGVLERLYEHYNSTHSSYVPIQSVSEISRMECVDVDDDDDDNPNRFIASQYKAFRQGKQYVGCVDEVAKYLMRIVKGKMTKPLIYWLGGSIILISIVYYLDLHEMCWLYLFLLWLLSRHLVREDVY